MAWQPSWALLPWATLLIPGLDCSSSRGGKTVLQTPAWGMVPSQGHSCTVPGCVGWLSPSAQVLIYLFVPQYTG